MEIDVNFDILITDIAINVVDELVEQGLVKDCTDTDDETEFYFQDAVKDVLHRYQACFNYE